VPAPGSHDLSYFGIFSSHDSRRRLFVRPGCQCKAPDHCRAHAGLDAHDDQPRVLPADPDALLAETVEEERYLRWADLVRKVHGFEVLDCPSGFPAAPDAASRLLGLPSPTTHRRAHRRSSGD
jgi:hypothetical protein